MPSIQLQEALWLDTEHAALGPQGFSVQGLTHLSLRQDSEALQSSSVWQPNTHLLCKHT